MVGVDDNIVTLLTQNSNMMIRIARILLLISVIFGGNTTDVHGCDTHDHSHKHHHRNDRDGDEHHDENPEGHNLRLRLGIFDTNVAVTKSPSCNAGEPTFTIGNVTYACKTDFQQRGEVRIVSRSEGEGRRTISSMEGKEGKEA